MPESFSPLAERRVSITIDCEALRHNLQVVRSLIEPQTRIFAVIKADAYGHGALAVAEVLQLHCASSPGVDGFAVVFVEEAVRLRERGVTLPILVLQGCHSEEEVILASRHQLWVALHDHSQLRLLREMQQASRLPDLNVWLKFDTQMGRIGFLPPERETLLSALQSMPNLSLQGVLSHLACADDVHDKHTRLQQQLFDSLVTDMPVVVYRSLANSAGTIAWPETRFDWVRTGVMLYGVDPLLPNSRHQGLPEGITLKPAMQVSAPIVGVKLLEAGQGVGYGQTYICKDRTCVGLVAMGYGDGFPRMVDQARVSINGSIVPVLGRVSMDSFAVDLSGVSAEVGDSAIIFGWDGLSVDQLATAAGTCSYEILCRMRGHRTYINQPDGSRQAGAT